MSIELVNINKYFDDYQALHDINLNVGDNEFIAVLGPSGCGKSTMLRLIAGFDRPSNGTILLDGNVVSSEESFLKPEDRNIGMVFQNFALWPHMTIREHLKFPIDYGHFVSDDMKKHEDERINEVLKVIDLEDRSEQLPNQLSGGQKQRVSLGRAIITQPSVLLMDEPLSSLDAGLRIEMRKQILQLHQQTQSAIIYVTHDQEEALAMADRIVVMRNGRIEQIGTPGEIYYEPQTEFVATFVGKANIFHGTWLNEKFRLDDGSAIWDNHGTTPALKEQNIYTLRPEQIRIIPKDTNQLTGTIRTRQFYGKEYHYSIEAGSYIVNVNCPISEKYDTGEEISLVPNN